MSCFSLGVGIGTKNKQEEWLEVFYPKPLLSPSEAIVHAVRASIPNLANSTTHIELSNKSCNTLKQAFNHAGATDLVKIMGFLENSIHPRMLTFLATDDKPSSTPEAYLKLHLLSHRLVKPHAVNIDGIFSLLPNVAWTSEGAIDIKELPERQLQARAEGRTLSVNSVDKFPKMTDYVVPEGTRIAHTARIRLGAYVGEGTTVMHEGFINFNAGTDGKSMVEGRISAGVFVNEGSDLGGGCSTMGTLSGGNKTIISVGKNCLIGANAGLGIPLGDRCIVEAGLYLTAGSKVELLDDQQTIVKTLKARDLSSHHDLLFRRNSLTGAIECLTNKTSVVLNTELHDHN
ncbi:2,3,4,5-tetrahydropyridine-2,6-dicarboxylate N-succinyltransferase [invertebrate metagenome]|uniref:2,3,4,5-tetrahydropyridine-2,6-dicarboxylate N-succinyltransferase n=1 Tax=invertebrate metagenome TaxID=1711999 RepID=A0A2H9TBF2_9ZZZZ